MKHSSEAGFSYIEIMIAMTILLIGVLALLSAISAAVLLSSGQEQQLNAKQMAASTMESLMSAKETDPSRLGWRVIGNVGTNPDVDGNPQGIFVGGRVQVTENAGPDEVIGTADDSGAVIPGYQREIVITDICDPDRPSPICPTPGTFPIRIRRVDVSIFYWVGGISREERLSTVLTDYSISE